MISCEKEKAASDSWERTGRALPWTRHYLGLTWHSHRAVLSCWWTRAISQHTTTRQGHRMSLDEDKDRITVIIPEHRQKHDLCSSHKSDHTCFHPGRHEWHSFFMSPSLSVSSFFLPHSKIYQVIELGTIHKIMESPPTPSRQHLNQGRASLLWTFPRGPQHKPKPRESSLHLSKVPWCSQ